MNTNRRTMIASTLAMGAAPLFRATPALAADASSVPLHLVHPDLRATVPMIEKFGKAANPKPMSKATIVAMRNARNPFIQKPHADVPFEKKMIAVGKGNPEVAIFIVNAKPGTNRPAILHTHGGGYVMGKAEDSVRSLQELCKELDCVAVSVDYRLAPETTYAGSIEDNYAGLKWLYDHADEIGADRKRIAVMGESAGGGHAAILAITARDRGEVPLCFQCLIYPMLDDRTGTTRKVAPHVGTLIWTPMQNKFGWESFLGGKAGGATAPKAAVPARLADLKGLPPAFIGVGSLDLFCDEDADYAQRLNAAAVSTELIVVQGAFHGFDLVGESVPLGRWFNREKVDSLRRAFGMPVSGAISPPAK